jgi:hypothetical protein
MSKTTFTINAKTLFPIDEIKKHIKEAFTIADQIGPAIITKGNRPAYAVIRLDSEGELSEAYSEQLDLARANARGIIATESDEREKP